MSGIGQSVTGWLYSGSYKILSCQLLTKVFELPYIGELQNREPNTRRLVPSILLALVEVVKELLQIVTGPWLVKIMPLHRGVDAEPVRF